MASSEIIVLLIIIILIIGVIVAVSEKNSSEIANKITDENLEEKAVEFADNLINNPGTPNNWNKIKNINNIVLGLAIVDENNNTVVNSVDYDKLIALKSNYGKLIDKQVFDDEFKSSITLTPLTGSVEEIKLGDDNLENPTTVNRLVMCNFLKKYTLGSFEENGACNLPHITTHSCNHFKIFKSYLKKIDYYLLFDEDSYKNYYWTISSTQYQEFPKLAESNKIYLNNIIEKGIMLESDGIIFVHINQKDPKAVLVAVPKNFDKNLLNYDYFTSTECNLRVQIAKA